MCSNMNSHYSTHAAGYSIQDPGTNVSSVNAWVERNLGSSIPRKGESHNMCPHRDRHIPRSSKQPHQATIGLVPSRVILGEQLPGTFLWHTHLRQTASRVHLRPFDTLLPLPFAASYSRLTGVGHRSVHLDSERCHPGFHPSG